MLIQGLADLNCLFLYVCVGWAGSVQDGRALGYSGLCKAIETTKLYQTRQSIFLLYTYHCYMIGDFL